MSVAALFSPTASQTSHTPPADVRDSLRVRLEEAALNATAVGAQLLYDGWLVRFSRSEAKRVRSVNVLGLSTRPLDERLAYCSSLYARHGLPMVLRITSIGPDFSLDAELESRGYTFTGETRVMSMSLAPRPGVRGGLFFRKVDTGRFAQAVGAMRGSAPEYIGEHQARLQGLAVDKQPVLVFDAHEQCVAAGLAVRDGDLLGGRRGRPPARIPAGRAGEYRRAGLVWPLRFQRLLRVLVPSARRADGRLSLARDTKTEGKRI